MKIHDVIVEPTMPSARIVEIFNAVEQDTLIVCGPNFVVLGVITARDVRAAFLSGDGQQETAENIMNPRPIVLPSDTSSEDCAELLESKKINLIPLVDDAGFLTGCYTQKGYISRSLTDTTVFIMAGGRGSRMMPLTRNTPKPLLKVWNQEMLGLIMDSFIRQGFFNFFVSVNYKAEQIETFVNERYGWEQSKGTINFDFVREDLPLGTCGSIAMVNPERFSEQIIVVNGDTVSNINYRRLLEYHSMAGSECTIVSSIYETQIPFGVIDKTNDIVEAVSEKPSLCAEIVLGIYCFDRDLVSLLPDSSYYDFPDFIADAIKAKRLVKSYLTEEKWADVGNVSALENVNARTPYC